MNYTVEEVAQEAGVTPNSLKIAMTLLFGVARKHKDELASGEALLLILYNILERFGFSSAETATICLYLHKPFLTDIGPALEGITSPDPRQFLLVIQDNRWVALEGHAGCFDMVEQKTIKASNLPMPIVYSGVGLAALYRKTLARIPSHRAEAAAAQSD